MSAERSKVLEMVAAGTITPDEAERLLDRLSRAGGPEDAGADDGVAGAAGNEGLAGAAEGAAASGAGDVRAGEGRPRALRFLRVVVDSPERDSIDIRLPLGLVRTGLKLSTLMPLKVGHRLSERGIDLSRLSGLDDEALIAELAAQPIDIAAEHGETVRIFCE